MQNIADHRPGGTGDNTDHPRHGRDRLFSFRVKQPLGGKAAAALFKLLEDRALTSNLDILNDDLIFRTAGEGRDFARDNNLEPFFRHYRQPGGDTFPAYRI